MLGFIVYIIHHFLWCCVIYTNINNKKIVPEMMRRNQQHRSQQSLHYVHVWLYKYFSVWYKYKNPSLVLHSLVRSTPLKRLRQVTFCPKYGFLSNLPVFCWCGISKSYCITPTQYIIYQQFSSGCWPWMESFLFFYSINVKVVSTGVYIN